MVSGLQSKDYEGRCKELALETLAERRNKQDMGLVYTMLSKPNELLTLSDRAGVRTRQTAGTKSLVAKFAKTDPRKFSFAVRTIDNWNGLPESIRQAATQDAFKRGMKNHRN
jgi:hypothetical protein